MSEATNYADVLRQLECAGLVPGEGLAFGTVKPMRCYVDGERTKKGWYSLFEFPLDNGDIIIVGSFGIWQGSDNGSQKIELPKGSNRTKEDNQLIRKRLADTRKRLLAEEKLKQSKAAKEAVRKFRVLAVDGESGYLTKKQVRSYGLRFTSNGAIAVPVSDTSGRLQGIQFILDKQNDAHKEKIKRLDGDKRFWPKGLKISGNFHLIGKPSPSGVIAVVEGYATGATIHEATGLTVAVVFNANNVLPALRNLSKHYKRSSFLICADDDYLCRCQHCRKQTLVADKLCKHCSEEHGKFNTGITVAMKAAVDVDTADWIIPHFSARDGRKITDFNDLHVEEGLAAVTAQIEAAVAHIFPSLGSEKVGTKAQSAAGAQHGGEGETPVYSGLMNVDQACERYSLIYGFKDTMFDHQTHRLIPKSCVMDVIEDHAWRDWKRDPLRKVVDGELAVGFDPGEKDPLITCNLWAGWPTTPSNLGSCEKIKDLLEYLCSASGDAHGKGAREVCQWVTKWLAYPIQHPGAKMRSALVFHGPQGTGKNIMFEDVVMQIYGRYGWIVNQDAIEDKFNDWASAKLFMVADEVVARADLYHLKNKLKGLVTGENIRINPKNVAAHNEKNHVNLVFMSNETMPLVLDKDDRRYLVIWTPPKLGLDFYKEVGQEIANGGIAAFHDYLLKVDLGDFNEHTKPIITQAKSDLIEISKDSPDRFIDEWQAGETDWPYKMCAISDLFKCYRTWCSEQNERYPLSQNRFSAHISKVDGVNPERFNILAEDWTAKNMKTKTVRAYMASDSMKGDETDMAGNKLTLLEWRTKGIRAFNSQVGNNE